MGKKPKSVRPPKCRVHRLDGGDYEAIGERGDLTRIGAIEGSD